jgi:hypothetical protein
VHEREDRSLPFVVDPRTGEEVHPDLSSLEGDLSADWYPDASALLVVARRAAARPCTGSPWTAGRAGAHPAGHRDGATARPTAR